LQDQKDVVQELVTANVKAINYILCHPKEAAKLWAEQIRINEDAIQLSLDRGISVYSLNVIPTEETMKEYTTFLRDAKILQPDDTPKIDPSFATKALHEVKSGETCMETGPSR